MYSNIINESYDNDKCDEAISMLYPNADAEEIEEELDDLCSK